jgi:hypothetical protein
MFHKYAKLRFVILSVAKDLLVILSVAKDLRFLLAATPRSSPRPQELSRGANPHRNPNSQQTHKINRAPTWRSETIQFDKIKLEIKKKFAIISFEGARLQPCHKLPATHAASAAEGRFSPLGAFFRSPWPASRHKL